MTQHQKDIAQYSSAIVMLLSAVVLAVWSFVRLSEIHNSIIAYVGEAIAFAAAVYGIALYTRNEIKREMRRISDENQLKREQYGL